MTPGSDSDKIKMQMYIDEKIISGSHNLYLVITWSVWYGLNSNYIVAGYEELTQLTQVFSVKYNMGIRDKIPFDQNYYDKLD